MYKSLVLHGFSFHDGTYRARNCPHAIGRGGLYQSVTHMHAGIRLIFRENV